MYRASQLELSWSIGQPVSMLGMVFVTVSSGWEGESVQVVMAELDIYVTVLVVAQN